MSTALNPSPTPRSGTILVVDDDHSVLKFVSSALSVAGYRVLTADGGRKAIEVHEKSDGPIHLLLTDIMMPDLTGPVVAERLCSVQPDLAVLFISGVHDADLLQRFMTKKGFALLPKPFTIASLLRGVEDAMRPKMFAA